MKTVRVSIKSMFQQFRPCSEDYIKNVCHGRCCEGSKGLMVTIHPSEEYAFRSVCGIRNGFVVPGADGKCPLKVDHLCSVHHLKPFGCEVSPFTLTPKGVLIVRNRYRLLKCYRAPGAIPVYRAHFQSLYRIFGRAAIPLVKYLDSIGHPFERYFELQTTDETWGMLLDNDRAKKGWTKP